MATVWSGLKGELAAATRDDFERLVLSLGRLLWRDLVRMERLKEYDRAGVDLAEFADDGSIVTAVQCKGLYSTEELDESHCRQIVDSIHSFIESPLSCVEYVVVHNRTGQDRKLIGAIEAALAQVVSKGKARRTKLRDRQTFTRDIEEAFDKLIIERLHEETADLLRRLAGIFEFGEVYVPTVPFSQFRLDMHRYKAPDIVQVAPSQRGNVADIMLSSAKLRWTVLTGMFGSGKSSAALQAVLSKSQMVIFVACADLPFHDGFGGTNTLLAQATGALHLFDDFADDDRQRLERLAGPLLRKILSRPQSNAILILDGLDENRAFSTTAGVIRLANALVELRCPVVLTTRQEHFDATFGNFDRLLDEYPAKGSPKRSARLLKLEPWSQVEIAEFLRQAAARAKPSSGERLTELAGTVSARLSTRWPAELLAHPLFLQMIAELAAGEEANAHSKTAMIEQWAERKIRRDLSVARLPFDVANTEAFVDQAMTLMEQTAARMIEMVDGKVRLLETVESGAVTLLASTIWGVPALDVAFIASTSLLVPVTQRRRVDVPMRYSHRVFQEYFTARHARRAGLAKEQLPESVADLLGELAQ